MSRTYSRRRFIGTGGMSIAGSAFGLVGLSRKSMASPGLPCNVLILKSDEHNPKFGSFLDGDHSGRPGYPTVDTPNMRRLAERGVVFRNTYCPSPLCMPSRSSFCSGKRVHEIQTYSNCNIPDLDYPSYGQILAKHGVHTVHIGKTDFYRPGEQLGFSEMISPDDRGAPDVNISRHPLAIRKGSGARANGYGIQSSPFRLDQTRTREALAWLRDTGRSLDRPWTLELNLIKPHFPHFVTEELWKEYAGHADLPAIGTDAESAQHPFAQDLRNHFQTDRFTGQQIRGLRRGYYGCIAFIDQQLGLILDALDELRLSENTVVAYTSDHGEMLGKFGMWWKSSLYEDSARVPLIIAGPGFARGAVVETPVDLLDLQATLFHTTGRGAIRPGDWAGIPLQQIDQNDTERVVFSEYQGHGTHASGFLIRKGDWKLLYNLEAPSQLFNLRDDPDELTDLALSQPEKFQELESELRKVCDPEKENDRTEERISMQLGLLKEKGLL